MQLRLELAESPAPAVALWELVGEQQRQAAMSLLAALIAQTILPRRWAMTWHRWEARARLEDGMTEARVGGGALQLVTVCLSDDGTGEVSDERGRPVKRAPVVSHLRPDDARALAFELLELAELAERRTEEHE